MGAKINNLVFEGGGVLGIAYLGVLDALSRLGVLQQLRRVAGTSAGAISACITSFNLPFAEIVSIANTLDYRQIPQQTAHPALQHMPAATRSQLGQIIGDVDSVYRLLHDYGWFSSEYIDSWIKEQIACQFDPTRKSPPYTFADFKDRSLHIDGRPFLDLYLIGTDISCKTSRVFSYKTTPEMEVAEAVRISMSIPLFFAAVKVTDPAVTDGVGLHVFADGGVMRNYPINLFDRMNRSDSMKYGRRCETLGARFISHPPCSEIASLQDYIKNLFQSILNVQQDLFNNNPADIARSIQIETNGVSAIDFDIAVNDETYRYLYNQGFAATLQYFANRYGGSWPLE